MSKAPLFVYGTLQDPDILAAILGRPVPPGAMPAATAPGYRAVYYPGRVYPALIASPDGVAPGLLLANLSSDELTTLDAFEGSEYRRATLEVSTSAGPIAATAYLPAIAIPADAEPWTLAAWTSRHRAAVLVAETAGAEAIRQTLRLRHR